MTISYITSISNKVALLYEIVPIRVIQIEGYVVDTERRCICNISIQRVYDWFMTTCLHEEVTTSIQKV